MKKTKSSEDSKSLKYHNEEKRIGESRIDVREQRTTISCSLILTNINTIYTYPISKVPLIILIGVTIAPLQFLSGYRW